MQGPSLHCAIQKKMRGRTLPSRRRSSVRPLRCKVTALSGAHSTSPSGQAHQSLDVAILGGGPAGLATAVSLRRACSQLNVKVFERVRAFTPRGAGLRLEVNGVKALQAIDPKLHSVVFSVGYNPSMMVQYSEGATNPIEFPMSGILEKELKLYGFQQRYIGWSDLQAVLADALPADIVQLDHQFERYELEEDGRVTLHFGSGTLPVTASVVIGCDGYRSKMRHQWLNDGPPQFAGTVIWRGRLPEEKSAISREYLAMCIRNNRAVAVYPGSEGCVVWNASTTVAAMEGSGVDRVEDRHHQFSTQAMDRSGKMTGAEIKRRAQLVFAQQPEAIRAVMDATDPEVILEHDICLRPGVTFPDHALGQGPLTLAGDAAHVIRPTGQGVNQSLEDALHLAHCISEGGPTADALRRYEALRLPRWKFSAFFSDEANHTAYKGPTWKSEKSYEGPRIDREEAEKQLWGVELKPLGPASLAIP